MRKRYFPTQTVPWPQWWGQYMLRPVWYPRKQGRVLWDITVPYHWVLYTETINSTMTMISQIYTYVTLFMQTHIAKTELCLVSQVYPTIDCTQRWMSLIFWLNFLQGTDLTETQFTAVNIQGVETEIVLVCRYLGVHLDNQLDRPQIQMWDQESLFSSGSDFSEMIKNERSNNSAFPGAYPAVSSFFTPMRTISYKISSCCI